MIINKITLENFQSYYDVNSFTFSKGVNIVSGKNGAGKSKLFNGFYYILFRYIYSEIQGDGWYTPNKFQLIELVNQRSKYKCENKKEIRCNTILELTTRHYSNNHFDEVLYTFKRGFTIVKNDTNSFEISQEEKFKIEITLPNGETEFIPSTDLNYVLDIIFPVDIRKYMWFQGETINELLDFRSGAALKLAVKNISYYPIYERIENICSIASQKNNSEQQKAIKRISKDQGEITTLTDQIEILRKKIANNDSTLDEVSNKIEELTTELHKLESNKDRLIAIQEARKNLEKHYERKKYATAKQDEARKYFKNRYSQVWMFYGLEQHFKKLSDRLSEQSDRLLDSLDIKNPVPYFIPGADHIQRCIDDQTCHFCEREAKLGSEAFKSLQKRLEDLDKFEFERVKQRNIFKEKSETLTILRGDANNKIDFDSKIRYDFEYNQKKYNDASDEFKKSILEIQKLDKQINHDASLVGQNDPLRAVERMRLIDHQVRTATARKNTALAEKPLFQSKLSEYQKRFQELSEKIDDKNPNVLAAKHFNILSATSRILKENAEIKLMNDIIQKSNEIYGNFLKSSGAPQGRISIENYEVEIKDGDRVIDINKGHSTVAKMSVINAVLSLSASKLGKSYPLISDAPSSVFDGTNVTAYTKNIGKEFEQVIIMSKDYSETSVMNSLLEINDIANIYEIENTQLEMTEGAPLHDFKIKITKLR